MNSILILVVMIIYFIQAAMFINTEQYAISLVFFAYGIANVGLYVLGEAGA